VLDASAVAQIDSTACAMLAGIASELAARGLALGFAEVHSEALELLERAGVIDRIGTSMVFDDLDDALRAFRARSSLTHTTSPH
jgi:MFS superfamily sulfate permease-like transporter